MGRTQHNRAGNQYEYSSDIAYDEYVQRTRGARQVVHHKKGDRKKSSQTFGELPWEQWEQDCINWRGMLLEGRYAHWCAAWDNLPMDETCPEWPCGCNIVQEVDGK